MILDLFLAILHLLANIPSLNRMVMTQHLWENGGEWLMWNIFMIS